ncbi:DUF418 domain-containing protein [Marinicella sp. W31]|uniref:DUF418 domain-containing protein n=1 Tax=Marinicella sp. W31 TaxID=3023713 RepID=UPI00375775F1
MIKALNSYQRIQSLDFLRGIAILGILLINIESFSYPNPWSPSAFGFEGEIDRTTRFFVYWLGQGKFFFMLTVLFGVGFCLFLDRAQEKQGQDAYALYLKRLFWLFVIGVVHAYLIWDGDILYHYAICGVILLLFQSFSKKGMVAVIGVLVAVLMFNNYQRTSDRAESLADYYEIKNTVAEDRSAAQQRRVDYWEGRLKKKSPDSDDIEVPRQTYMQSIQTNYEKVEVHKGVVYHKSILYSTLIMMLVGVLLFRSGIFQDYKVVPHYWLMTLAVTAAALAINYFRYDHWTYHYEQPVTQIWQGWLFAFPRETLGLAYVLLFNGLYQKFGGGRVSQLISNVGRMALTNYIMQSIICGLIFYGYGLGFYNQLSRFELLPIVLAIVLLQILFSWIWLKRNAMGPIEFVWRKMIYGGR